MSALGQLLGAVGLLIAIPSGLVAAIYALIWLGGEFGVGLTIGLLFVIGVLLFVLGVVVDRRERP